MRLTRRAWTTALATSILVHGGVAAWLTYAAETEEPPLMEGGPGVSLAISGDPFDAVAQGSENAEADTAETIEAETAEATTSEIIEAEPPSELQPPEEVQTAEVTEQVPPEPAPVETVSPVEPEPQPTPPEQIVAEVPEAVETAEAQEVAPAEVAAVTETVEAMEPPIENVPVPQPRPEPPRRVASSEPAPKETERTERRQQRRETAQEERRQTQSGDRGRQQTNARRGSQENGQSAQSGGGRSGANASAARSNYAGQVLARIRRAQRYPSSARRQRAEGTVTVAFTVTAGGGASSVRLAGSSGNGLLDRAAVETVQRAAPFPPIPREAGRSTMSFTVPIRFQLR